MGNADFKLKSDLSHMADELLYQIKDCEDYFHAWVSLQIAVGNYNSEICIARDFFSVASSSLLCSLMTGLCKLYDKDSDCISVQKCLNKCNCSQKIISHIRTEGYESVGEFFCKKKDFESYLSNGEQTILKYLRERRDRYYMHNDKICFDDESYLITNAPLTFDDIEELLAKAAAFCGLLYRFTTGKIWKPAVHRHGTVAIVEHNRDFSGLEQLLSIVDMTLLNS